MSLAQRVIEVLTRAQTTVWGYWVLVGIGAI